jgi:hypothetical protein
MGVGTQWENLSFFFEISHGFFFNQNNGKENPYVLQVKSKSCSVIILVLPVSLTIHHVYILPCIYMRC